MKRATKLAHKKLVSNITHCYLDADPVQIQGGMAWYAAAYDAAYDIGNKYGIGAVSYTHLTLPTKRIV